jgi:hypothetical protein
MLRYCRLKAGGVEVVEIRFKEFWEPQAVANVSAMRANLRFREKSTLGARPLP